VLDHPNIAVVHEIEETDTGQLFISMACHEGETLRERLERGPRPVTEAVELARQIASALAATHQAGIVHRDIKPSNVLITTDGVVKVVDFGIAKAAGEELTREGIIVGTVAYMSPEQTRSEVIDPRTDVWSLGVVLYEMLAGVRPFRADSTPALVHAIRHDDPEPVDRIRPEVPFALARLVDRCLAKDPADRCERVASVIADLDDFARSDDFGRSVEGARVAEGPDNGRTTSRAAGGLHRIAVLPLADAGSDPDDAYFADALTSELITCLSAVSALRVTASATILRYRDRGADPAEVGRELGVQALLVGRARKAGPRVSIALQLIDVPRDQPVWAGEFEADFDELPVTQSEIVRRIAGARHVRITPHERRRLAAARTERPAANALYLKARHLLNQWDRASATRAVECFRQALDLDPAFARAWSGLAHSYTVLAGLTALSAEEAYRQARTAAEKALDLDHELGEAHTALATALSYHYLDPRAAERHFRRAIDLDPSNAAARGFYAEQLRNQGRFDEALSQIHAAQELNPSSPAHEFEEGLILYVARRYEKASEHLQRLLNADHGFHVAYFGIALVMVQLERYDEALDALQALDPERQSPDARSLRGYIYAVTGRRAEAQEMLASLGESLDDPQRAFDVSPFHAAVIHVGLGDRERALDLLCELRTERSWHAGLLKVEPMLDPLRASPRFQTLLEEVGLHQPPPLLTPISRPR
jgi:serine/threonine-protein kinase